MFSYLLSPISYPILLFVECLSAFLKTREGTKCPICRAPVSGEAPPPPPPTQPRPRPPGSGGDSDGSGGGGNGSGSGRCCADSFNAQDASYNNVPSSARTSTRTYHSDTTHTDTMYHTEHQNAEYIYRINRMNYLYPRVMTTPTMFALNNALSNGNAAEFRRLASVRTTEVNQTITNIEIRNAARSSGSSGSSYGSFGGGSR